MKRKKRHSGGGGIGEVVRCGTQKHGIDEDSRNDYDRMHVLEVCDDLDAYHSASTPEIHVVRLSPVPVIDDGDLLGGGLFSNSGVRNAGVRPNPEPCEREASVSSCFGTSAADGLGLGLGLDFILSPLALKEPMGSQEFIEGFEKLLEMKFGIMALRIRHGLDAWLLGSRMVHPFEILSFVAAKPVLSRAYFKMWEMIQMFDLVPTVAKNRRFLSAHLCEGPGGFVEAVREYRAESSIAAESNDHGKEENSEAAIEIDSTVHSTTGTEHRPQTITMLPNEILEAASCWRTSITDSPSDTNGLEFYRLNRESSRVAVGYETYPKGVRTPNVANGTTPELNSLRGVDRDLIRQNEDNETSTPKSPPVTDQLSQKRSSSIASTNFKDPLESMEGAMSNGMQTSRVHGGNVEANVETLSRCPSSTEKTSCFESWNKKLCRSPHSPPSPPAPPPGTGVEGKAADNSESLLLSSVTTRTTTVRGPYHDLWFGLTLALQQKERAAGRTTPPRMEMSKLNEKKEFGNSQGHVHYGVDGSGDVTNPANVSAFVEYILSHSGGQKMDLVTADGAFDVSEDFSSQEHRHLNLVFCEMVAALRIQAKGGSFVLKLFDCYTASTITVLFILSALYRSVDIVRLRTTRICNSERYVVAKGFLGLSPKLEESLVRLNVEWSMAVMRGEKVGLLLSGGVFPNKLLDAVMESNAAISAEQIDGISRALQLANVIGERLPSPLSYGRRKGSVSMLRRKLQTVKRMQRNATALCKELKIRYKPQFATEVEDDRSPL